VWQEFPLSSSGLDNIPPRGERALAGFPEAARWTVTSLRHHPCVLLWCGGNELTDAGGVPCVADREPVLAAFAKMAAAEDPERRFVPTSPSGPRFGADKKDYGKGIHWDTHGPWSLGATGLPVWEEYWAGDDSLFRSEVGSPGASSVALIEKYAGGEATYPCRNDMTLWRRTPWWTEWKAACEELGGEPATLAAYVEWSQKRQARALEVAARRCKSRFPSCGGFLVWMGHDAFPCTANTAIIEFDGAWKPAATALQKVFLGS
jgi:beta-mannosidase